jgi:hypothetical protein
MPQPDPEAGQIEKYLNHGMLTAVNSVDDLGSTAPCNKNNNKKKRARNVFMRRLCRRCTRAPSPH